MISGGIKFFEPGRFAYGESNVEVQASSGNGIARFLIDKNPLTSWRSVGSDDTRTETVRVDFPACSFNRLIFRNHNWKEFRVRYLSGGAWTEFASVVGLDGALVGGISESDFEDDTAYYEFTEVEEITAIGIEITKTQTANEQKFCFQVIATSELGTFEGYPELSPWSISRNQRSKKMLSGKHYITKSEKSFDVKLGFSNYSPSYSDDLDLMFELFDREEPFLVWLCGGRRDSTYFRYAPEGIRLQDIYLVQVDSSISSSFYKNIYTSAVNLGNIVLREWGGDTLNDGEVAADSFTLANSQAVAADIEGLSFSRLDSHWVRIEFDILRYTDTAASELKCSGELELVYNTDDSQWEIASRSRTSGDVTTPDLPAGITFSITADGQLQYTSTTISGTNYFGELSWKSVQILLTDTSATILNNQSSPVNLGLTLDKTSYRTAVLDFGIDRTVSGAGNQLKGIGRAVFTYNSDTDQWSLNRQRSFGIDAGVGADPGVTLSITTAGVIQYISSDLSGSSYSGTLYRRLRTFSDPDVTEVTIANGQASVADILSLDNEEHRTVILEYEARRKTATASSEVRVYGYIVLSYSQEDEAWTVEFQDYSGDILSSEPAGVTFSVDSGDELFQYISTTIAGSSYSGTMRLYRRNFDA